MIGRSMRLRIAATAGLFAVIFAVLMARAVELTVIQGKALRQRAAQQHQQQVPVRARRGSIVDRHGTVLALTRESAAVYLRPPELTADTEALATVARLLDLPVEFVAEQAQAKAPFVWLSRHVPLDRWSAVEDLGLTGIGSEPSHQRVYPHEALAGQVLGFTGIDGQGLEGVERLLDAKLQGEVEALDVERDARGRRIAVGERWRPLPRVGAQVDLTIDAEIQRAAEIQLERAVQEFDATGGSVVVLVPATGEVLALANVPRFDPNRFAEASADQWRNRVVTDFYEPGSTLKAVLAAEVLERNLITPRDQVFCENGSYAVGRRVIHDHTPHGMLSFADVIALSSNIGCAKVAERLGRDHFAAALVKFGFGGPTGVDLPGEVGGLVRPVEQWRRIHLVTTAFGQGIAVTPLQLAHAFAAIANGGRLLRPFIVRRVVGESGRVLHIGEPRMRRQVMSPETSAVLTGMLVRAVQVGTGQSARLDGFTVAGKTGTAQKVDEGTGRYHPQDRVASFIGYLPAENPELVILVVVDSPKKATYGGTVAAPVFRRIAEYALSRRGVLPRSTARREWVPDTDSVPLPAMWPAPSELDGNGVPSFLGLSMREALRQAQEGGWRVRVQGSGYVIAQEPPPGANPAARELLLQFGSAAL